jgi:signal transduction histidine kinase
MPKKLLDHLPAPGALIALAVLAILLIYTFALLFLTPYSGFYFNPSNGEVLAIEVDQPAGSTQQLQMGDVIERIGSTPIEVYANSWNINPYAGLKPGETIELQVRVDGKLITIPWVYAGFNRAQFLSRFLNIWWLAYVFWAIGMSTQLFLRPKDTQWRLFVSSNYLMGLFIMFGSVSSFQTMASPLLMRITAWLLLPVYLHFHWIFPVSFRRIPSWAKWAFYALCFGVVLAEVFQLLPRVSYFFAVILAFGGSILLLTFHYILQPAHRREVKVLAIAAFLALFPVVVFSAISSMGHVPAMAPVSLLVLPILPVAYFYILYVYRRNLGGLELRANRGLSLYIFLILLGTFLMLGVAFLGVSSISRELIAFGGVMVSLIATFLGIQFFPEFQSLIERRLLGIKLPSQNMVENFSAGIVTSTTLADLLELLQKEVFPSLLIRQYAFLRVENSIARVILSENVSQPQALEEDATKLLASLSPGRQVPPPDHGQRFEWVRLMLPLRVGSDLIGAWLLGRRDPDDLYPQAERQIIQSLANQTAVALSNIIQTGQLKAAYEANINRYEEERLRLAHDLHDSVLNEMAALFIGGEAPTISPKFQQGYEALTSRLREIVSNLRPPMLTFGLKLALDGLADTLSERSQDTVRITTDIAVEGDGRFMESIENNIYRIIQEACENAIRHGQAKHIAIFGTFGRSELDLCVEDDGTGSDNVANLSLNELIRQKHFGLAGMLERAITINAELKITSKPEEGTRIRIRWASPSPE